MEGTLVLYRVDAGVSYDSAHLYDNDGHSWSGRPTNQRLLAAASAQGKHTYRIMTNSFSFFIWFEQIGGIFKGIIHCISLRRGNLFIQFPNSFFFLRRVACDRIIL